MITEEGRVLLYYSKKFKVIGNCFSVRDLLNHHPFLKYFLPSDNFETILKDLVQHGFLNREAQNQTNTYCLPIRSFEDDYGVLNDVIEFMITNHTDIIKRIPISEFENLDALMCKDPCIKIFSELYALGSWKWWEILRKLSSAYNKAMENNGSIIEFLQSLSQIYRFKILNLDKLDEIEKYWTKRGLVYITCELDAITPWRDLNPVIFIAKSSIFTDSQNKMMALKNQLRINGITSFLVIVLGETATILRQSLDALVNMIVIYPADLKNIAQKKIPSDEFRNFIKNRISLHLISPYQVDGWVDPDLFYGRESEIDTILNNKKANFVIYGMRKIGKTSLLRKLEQIYSHEEKPIYIDCMLGIDNEEQLVKYISSFLRLQNCKNLNELSIILAQMEKHVLLLLDEIDVLFNGMDKENIIGLLRAVTNQGFLRIIVAGSVKLHELSMDSRNPSYNFLNPIKLAELKENAALELAKMPMLSLGVSYEKGDSTVSQLLYFSSKYPNMIQYICDKLILLLDNKKKRIITSRDIKNVYEGDDFQNFVDSHFYYSGLSPLEQLIILQNLLSNPFEETLIYKKLESVGITLPIEQIDNALKNLELLCIFERNGTRYKYAYQHFPDIFKRKHDVDFLLQKLARTL